MAEHRNRSLDQIVNEAQTLHCAGIYNMARLLPAYVILSVLTTLLVQHSDAQFDRIASLGELA